MQDDEARIQFYKCFKIPLDILNGEREDKFLDQYALSFERASSPDLIIWEHLGMDKCRVLLSKAIVAMVVLLILVFCWTIVIYLSNQKS